MNALLDTVSFEAFACGVGALFLIIVVCILVVRDRIHGFSVLSRSALDTRIGFIIHTDRVNVLIDEYVLLDEANKERVSKFNFGISLCLIWWRVGFTVYL